MTIKTFAAALLAAIAFASDMEAKSVPNGGNWTPLTITEDGSPKQVWIGSPDWYSGGGGSEVLIPYGGRS